MSKTLIASDPQDDAIHNLTERLRRRDQGPHLGPDEIALLVSGLELLAKARA